MKADLIKKGMLSEDEDERINNSAMEEISQAFAFANNSSIPDGKEASEDNLILFQQIEKFCEILHCILSYFIILILY